MFKLMDKKIITIYASYVVYFRYFLETVMGETLSELIQNCTFGILAETVRAEKERKAQLLETILK